MNFEGCDKDKNHLLNGDELKDCISNETVFGNTTKYNDQLAENKDANNNELLKSLDFHLNQSLNFFQYLLLRKASYAFGKCVVQDGELNFKNYPVAEHLAIKRL